MLSGGAVRADGSGGVCIPEGSHITNQRASGYVRTCQADRVRRGSYTANMARRGIPKEHPAWFLREWMATCGVKTQAAMMEKTGWPKATMSQLYNGKQDFNSKILKEAADALGVETHELLMAPDRAMAARRMRQAAVELVHDVELVAADRSGTNG